MLIDVTKKPVSMVPTECQTIVVIRSLAVSGKADGLIHQNFVKIPRTIAPAATFSRKADYKWIETILPARDDAAAMAMERKRRDGTASKYVPGTFQLYECPQGTKTPRYSVVTGFLNRMTNLTGVARINFVFDHFKEDNQKVSQCLLTLLDETTSTALFTVCAPLSEQCNEIVPLQKRRDKELGEGGLWGAILDNDYF